MNIHDTMQFTGRSPDNQICSYAPAKLTIALQQSFHEYSLSPCHIRCCVFLAKFVTTSPEFMNIQFGLGSSCEVTAKFATTSQ